MPKYEIEYHRTDFVLLTIEADDEDSALEAGFEALPELCYHCSTVNGTDEVEETSIDAGEWEDLVTKVVDDDV